MPESIGPYEIKRELDSGAMGKVYEAWDPKLARRVAIKTVRLRDGLRRFRQEAQAAAQFSHPNIVTVYDYGETGDLAYIVMEFVDGGNWKQMLLNAKPPAANDVLRRYMDDLLAGLQYSHDQGVVHRDIKPANLMLTSQGQTKIADFGIARVESSGGLTEDGTILGTPPYMSPEQFTGVPPVDHRTDIYAAGVVLCELLTGKRPFEGDLNAILYQVVNEPPPLPSRLLASATASLDDVVARAMAKQPDQRFQSAHAMAEAIHQALQIGTGPPEWDATKVGGGFRPPPPREPLATSEPGKDWPKAGLITAAAIAGLLLVGGGSYYLFSGKQEASPSAVVTVPPAPAPKVVQPVVVPAPPAPPVPLPQPPPAPPAPPLNLQAIRAALGAVKCSLAQATVSSSGVLITGVSGRDGPEQELADAVRKAAPGATATRALRTFDGPFCQALDMLRPLATEPPAGVTLALQDGRTELLANDLLLPRVILPEFAGFLQLDYLENGGDVDHLHNALAGRQMPLPAGSLQRFGDVVPGFDGWRISNASGHDMIIAIAASRPLFAAPRPDAESIDTYMPVLQAALDGARRRGDRLAAAVLLVDTEAKQ